MKHVGPIELQHVLLTPDAFGRPVKRKNFLKRLIIALHVSRRRQARSLIHSYRHLAADAPLDRLPNPFLDFGYGKESNQNANADQTAVRANSRTDHA